MIEFSLGFVIIILGIVLVIIFLALVIGTSSDRQPINKTYSSSKGDCMRKNTMRSPEIRYGVSSIPPTDPSPPSDLPEDHDVSRLPRDDKCAKCGHWDTTLRYVSAYKTSCIGANHPVDEHMHVICNTCEYMWAEMPLSNG